MSPIEAASGEAVFEVLMAPGGYRFDRFVLDAGDRQLRRDDAPVELNARYLDALALLVREQGRLVSKDRFFDEVWRGVPVTDEALTQCISALRRVLGDSAASPRFIETVPKHGLPLHRAGRARGCEDRGDRAGSGRRGRTRGGRWGRFFALGAAGTIGGGAAGVFVGLLYGLGASEPLEAGMGAVSVLLVLVCLSIALGLLAGAAVSFGVAAAGFAPERRWWWSVVGGGGGGLVMGTFGKLLGLDAFNLLFGQTPGDITGAVEGALLGGAVGLGAWLGERVAGSVGRGVLAAGLVSGGAGLLITGLGGRLLGGSLHLLAIDFPSPGSSSTGSGGCSGRRASGRSARRRRGRWRGCCSGAASWGR
jgi:DNA-binding winged helix-turn-helix (wHTH) protein